MQRFGSSVLIHSTVAPLSINSMPLLRLCGYNLGVNVTDKKKETQMPPLLWRLWEDNVDLVCLQETRPHVGQSYQKHPAVEAALVNSPFFFATGGNCSSGGRELLRSTPCRQFPQSRLDKYDWRMFSKSVFNHHGLVVMVLNSHTRSASGRNDTADEYRIAILKRCKEEVIKEQAAVDLVVVSGDFNMVRPWQLDVVSRFEAAMTIPGMQTLFMHSVPDHIVVYVINKDIQVDSFQTSSIPPIGKAHDGVGDHKGMLADLRYHLLPPPAQTTLSTIPEPETQTIAPSIAKVVKPWDSIGGGYLSLMQHDLVFVDYTAAEDTDENGWCYGQAHGNLGWFPRHCIQYGVFVKASANWTTEDGGYMALRKDDILEIIYTGTAGEERGWIYARCDNNSGWCPANCV